MVKSVMIALHATSMFAKVAEREEKKMNVGKKTGLPVKVFTRTRSCAKFFVLFFQLTGIGYYEILDIGF